MALLGDDGRGYELARKLESHGVWRSWLGDSLYANFVHFLSSPSSWDAFMRTDDSKSRAQIQLQLRARALLFDKACVSLFLRSKHSSSSSSSSSSSIVYSAAVSKLNPNYLQLHGDDVYFTLENCSQDGVQQRDGVVTSNIAPSKLQAKAAFSIGSRYGESEIDNMSQRFRHEELPETWYSQFFEKYKASKPYRLSFGDCETDKRTPEQMSTYLRMLEKHKRRRVAFKEDKNTGFSNPILENGSNMHPNSVLDDNNSIDDDTSFFPETMFTLNCVPDSALPPTYRVDDNQRVEFNGVLDTLPQILTRSPIMIERLGIRPEYLSIEQGGNQGRGKNASEGNRKHLGQEQASQMSQKVITRMLTIVGFEATSEVPMEVLSQLLSCHICKLGRILKVLADSYRKECSAIELLKMFLQTAGHSNLGALAEIVKDNTRNFVQQTQQQVQGIQSQSQLQPLHQAPLRQPQQIPRQMYPQMVQQWDRMRRGQPSTPRPGMNMSMEKERPLVEVKIENPSDFPMDSNAFTTINTRHPQLQFRQPQIAAMSNFQAQSGNQFKQLASLQIPQVQMPNMGIVRAQPVKVEGFQELMGGDATLKHDSVENKLTSPSK
uniref:Bromodomain associated domain-containing protein n=1 Tax=Davidia involucrata TaxID=16924 RepID=A0A5B7AW21_DAVIN